MTTQEIIQSSPGGTGSIDNIPNLNIVMTSPEANKSDRLFDHSVGSNHNAHRKVKNLSKRISPAWNERNENPSRDIDTRIAVSLNGHAFPIISSKKKRGTRDKLFGRKTTRAEKISDNLSAIPIIRATDINLPIKEEPFE